MMQLYPELRAAREQMGKDPRDAVSGSLRMAGALLPMAIPGTGVPAMAARTAAGVLPTVAARGVETRGDLEAMLKTGGAQLALSGLGEGVGKALSSPAVQKAAIKTAGFFTGPFSFARNRGQYDDWAESLMRLNNEHGVQPAGFASTIANLKKETQEQLAARLAQMDAKNAAGAGSALATQARGNPAAGTVAPANTVYPNTSTPSPRPRLNVSQAALDAARDYTKRVGKGSIEGASSEQAAAREASEIVADLLTRNQQAPATARVAQKENLAPFIQRAIEDSALTGNSLDMNTELFTRRFGYDPFNIPPSELHELNKGLGQDIERLLEAASESKRLPREGSLALRNEIHQALRNLLRNADDLPVEEGGKNFSALQQQYSDLMNADKFRGAVRRDPAMFPMRAGFGGAVTSGLGRAAQGVGVGTMVGGPAGGALGGLAAVVGLEPSVLYNLLYNMPRLGAKYGPSVGRGLGAVLRPVPSHDTEE
jgi:hypothetical protein